MDILNLSLLVTEKTIPEDIRESVANDIRLRIEQPQDSKSLFVTGETLVLAGIIVQTCAIAVQIASTLVQIRTTSKQAAQKRLLDEIVTQVGDPEIVEDETLNKIIEAAIDEIECRNKP